MLTFAMLSDGKTGGATSSFVIVPVAVAVPIVAFDDAPESVTRKVSSVSTVVSPFTTTLNVPVVEPAAIVTVPLPAT